MRKYQDKGCNYRKINRTRFDVYLGLFSE